MRVFLTGANGWIGSMIARDLITAGHSVAGLVRSASEGHTVAAAGITPIHGALTDLSALRDAAREADGIIHTAFGLDFSNYAKLSVEDREAIETFADVFGGSDRALVVTSGLGQLPAGTTFSEASRPEVDPAYPRASEQTAFRLAERGLRASVVRPARAVHGLGERHGFIPQLATIARDKGFSAYIGDGQSQWPAVHRVDAARVYRLALERGAGNEAYHAVAESVPLKAIAEAIGRQLGVPARSLSQEESESHFGGLAIWVTGSGSVESDQTRKRLEWMPQEVGLITDIDRPEYYA